MPRITRNFWGEIRNEGGRIIATGPKSLSAKMFMTLFIREKKEISPISLHVDCVPFTDEHGNRKNRVIVYWEGAGSEEKVEVRPEDKQMTVLLEA
jgi:hypothetical protein